MKSLINPLRNIGFLTVALTLALAANFAYGQWVNPPASPPTGNVAASINTSANPQNKPGTLGATFLNSEVSSAITQMNSPAYCGLGGSGADGVPFTSDDDCFTATDATAGGGTGFISGTDLERVSKMYQAWGTPAPNGMYAWPDWVKCGKDFDISGNRRYKENYDSSGVDRLSFSSSGGGSCGGVRDICLTRSCGIYGTGASGADLVINPGDVCNAYGCSPFGACTSGGCPTSIGQTCTAYGCSDFGACTPGGCPTSIGQTCDAYGCF